MFQSSPPEISYGQSLALLNLSWILAEQPPLLSPELTSALQGHNSSLVARLRSLSPSQVRQLKIELRHLIKLRTPSGPLRLRELLAAVDSLRRGIGNQAAMPKLKPATREHDANRCRPTEKLEALVVEDHRDTRLALQRLLRRWGHRVHGAGTLREAFEKLSGTEFDVILLDIMLPDGQGFELLERADLMQAYVIVLTAWATTESRAKAAKYGCRDFLLKPEGIDRLASCLGEAMRERAAKSSASILP